MKRLPSPGLGAVLFGALLGTAAANVTVDIWTGTLPTGWQGGIIPNTGDDIYLGRAVNQGVVLTGSITLDAVVFAPDGDTYTIDSSSPVTLGLTSGLSAGDNNSGRLVIEPNIVVSISGSTGFNAGNNSIVVFNKLTGTGSPVFLGNPGGMGAFLFVNNIGSNDYTGNTIVGDGTGFPTIAFWGASPFGTGTVTFLNGGNLIAHNNTPVIGNNLVFNSVGFSNFMTFKSWDAPLTLTGSVTLANNTTISASVANPALPAADGTGSFPQPGPLKRNPVIFSGDIGESGSPRLLNIANSGGIFILSGANTYTGGTNVNGNLVFGTNGAIPGTGTVLVNGSGYAGLGDVTAANFAAQIMAHFNLASSGAIGVDNATGSLTSPVTLSDSINLSSGTGNGTTPLGFTNSSIRIGTATAAILTGSITPQGVNYQFGNGGGSLYVQTSLGDTAGNGAFFTGRQVQLNNSGNFPLKLFLQGANTYSGGTVSSNGILVFDGASAVPTTGSFTATGSSTFIGNSYLGYTDTAGILGTPFGANAAAFLGLFNKTSTWGIIGFDTHAGNLTANYTGPIDLTGFNDGVYLGTATSAILSGAITPSTVANTNNTAHTLRLTAVNGGTLTVNSTLADNGPALALSLGAPNNNNNFSDGTVVLNGTNTYTGGTTINAGGMGLTIVAGGSGNAFGTGAITVASGASFGLQVATPSLTVANPINFISGGALYFTGANDIILGGALSGSGSLNLYNAAPINATLAGDNSALTGDLLIGNGTLNLKNNNAAGQGTVYFQSSAATVAFGGAATAPVLHGIDGSAGSLVLPNSSTLTFQVDDDNQGSEFGGTISATAGTTNATNAAVIVTASNGNSSGTLYLYGHNYYTGGTTISGYGALGLGASDSAGSGPVTINATNGQGGLILNTGVSFTNALVLTSGGLAGLGAFNPISVNGDSTPGRTITFGTNQLVYPGIPGDGINLPGVLTIQTNVAFANNGSFREMIQNPGLTGTITGNPTTNINAGFGQLFVQGNLDLTSLATGGFFISLESVDPTGHKGFSSSVTWGQSYSLLLVQTTGTISGFNAANFTVDASNFQDGQIPDSAFSVSNPDSQHLYLNFTAIPEPSTWALLATGAGFLGLAAWRKSRRSA